MSVMKIEAAPRRGHWPSCVVLALVLFAACDNLDALPPNHGTHDKIDLVDAIQDICSENRIEGSKILTSTATCQGWVSRKSINSEMFVSSRSLITFHENTLDLAALEAVTNIFWPEITASEVDLQIVGIDKKRGMNILKATRPASSIPLSWRPFFERGFVGDFRLQPSVRMSSSNALGAKARQVAGSALAAAILIAAAILEDEIGEDLDDGDRNYSGPVSTKSIPQLRPGNLFALARAAMDIQSDEQEILLPVRLGAMRIPPEKRHYIIGFTQPQGEPFPNGRVYRINRDSIPEVVTGRIRWRTEPLHKKFDLGAEILYAALPPLEYEGFYIFELVENSGQSTKFWFRHTGHPFERMPRAEAARTPQVAKIIKKSADQAKAAVERAPDILPRCIDPTSDAPSYISAAVDDFILESEADLLNDLSISELTAMRSFVESRFLEVRRLVESRRQNRSVQAHYRKLPRTPGFRSATARISLANNLQQEGIPICTAGHIDSNSLRTILDVMRATLGKLVKTADRPVLDLCVTSEPPGVNFSFRPVSERIALGSGPTTVRFSGVYRGIYHYELEIPGYKKVDSDNLDLINGRGELLECKLVRSDLSLSASPCRLANYNDECEPDKKGL